jgi:hypothetical protein
MSLRHSHFRLLLGGPCVGRKRSRRVALPRLRQPLNQSMFDGQYAGPKVGERLLRGGSPSHSLDSLPTGSIADGYGHKTQCREKQKTAECGKTS